MSNLNVHVHMMLRPSVSTRMIPRRPGVGDRKYSRSQTAGKVPEFTGTFFEKVEKGRKRKGGSVSLKWSEWFQREGAHLAVVCGEDNDASGARGHGAGKILLILP